MKACDNNNSIYRPTISAFYDIVWPFGFIKHVRNKGALCVCFYFVCVCLCSLACLSCVLYLDNETLKRYHRKEIYADNWRHAQTDKHTYKHSHTRKQEKENYLKRRWTIGGWRRGVNNGCNSYWMASNLVKTSSRVMMVRKRRTERREIRIELKLMTKQTHGRTWGQEI